MKIIINENKLNNFILDYINNFYDLNNIHSNPFMDDYGNPVDVAIEYYLGDFDGDEYQGVFRLYKEDYWSTNNDYRKNISPILMLEDENFINSLNAMFGDRWQPILKDWFENTFGEKVKTIDYYS